MSQNGQTHFKNLAALHPQDFQSVSHFGTLCIKGLKMMKNAFNFILKALFVHKMFKFLSWTFGNVENQPGYKNKVNFKIYDVTSWLTNNCNTHID